MQPAAEWLTFPPPRLRAACGAGGEGGGVKFKRAEHRRRAGWGEGSGACLLPHLVLPYTSLLLRSRRPSAPLLLASAALVWVACGGSVSSAPSDAGSDVVSPLPPPTRAPGRRATPPRWTKTSVPHPLTTARRASRARPTRTVSLPAVPASPSARRPCSGGRVRTSRRPCA